VLSHYNIRRVVDVFGAVQDRDLGAVGRDIARVVDANRSLLPRGSFITVARPARHHVDAYRGLLEGLVFAIVLAYLLIVVNFQSWLDPFHHHHRAAGGAGRHRGLSCSGPGRR